MDISATIQAWKKEPGFTANVGMILVHNGVVRATSRSGQAVSVVRVRPDRERISTLCREAEALPGIWRARAEAAEGELAPGDDLLFLLVAGDFRENVKSALSWLLDRVKAEAVTKEEVLA